MKPPVEFITASAGSGKTYRLVEIVADAIKSNQCRPDGVIATTFTVAAANELRERLASGLYERGQHEKAILLESGMIGTVHSICKDILTRFSLEAGLSPELSILDETQSQIILSQAFDQIFPDNEAQELSDLSDLSDILGQRERMSGNYNWRKGIQAIVENARSNGIDPGQLPAMAIANWDEMRRALPAVASDDLDQQLREAIKKALDELDPTPKQQNASKCRFLLKDALKALDHGTMTWDHWDKLIDPKPAAAQRESVQPVSDVASRWAEHPLLHDHLKDYLVQTFEIARRLYEAFIDLKQKKGVADFGDLEKETLELLRSSESVRNTLKENTDLLVVDEFQDTSPIQLALFSQLAECAKRIVWVGDIKQAIYGFRNADPELIRSAVGDDQVKKADNLSSSWRSVPDLVHFVNELFTPAFARHLNLQPEDVRLHPEREACDEAGTAIRITEVTSDEFTTSSTPKLKALTNAKRCAASADAIKGFLDSDCKIIDKKTSNAKEPCRGMRPVSPKDVAVLVRTNANAQSIARELRLRGIEVSLSCTGLLKTPEARLAIACLRVLADPKDSLAVAEVIALEGDYQPEQWVTDRIGYLKKSSQKANDKPHKIWGTSGAVQSSSVSALVEARSMPEIVTASPLTLFELCYDIADLPEMVSQWGPTQERAEQRLLNLSGVRELIEQHQNTLSAAACPVTLPGLFSWLEDMAEEWNTKAQDKCPVDPGIDAVHVGTYHGSKGLEWPVVFADQLDTETRTRLFTLQAHNNECSFTLSDPLANRTLRQWIAPLPNKKNNVAKHALEESETGQKAMEAALSEDLRLLYVGFTRARDILILLHDPAKPSNWLGLADPTDSLLAPPEGLTLGDRTLPLIKTSTTYEEYTVPHTFPGSIRVPARSTTHTDRLPLNITPSSQTPDNNATVSKTIEFGQYLGDLGNIDDRDYGDAMHRIIATEILTSGHPNRIARANRMLSHWNLENNITPERAVETIDRYREWIERTHTPSEQQAELPFDYVTAEGQQVTGFIDHLLITPNGPVIIDHKSFRGNKPDLEQKALTYSGQLALYREVVHAAYPDLPPPTTWIHFITSGIIMEIAP